MATVTIRYWAAAKDAAGVAEEEIEAGTLGEALAQIVVRRSPGPAGDRLRAVLSGSSFLVDGDPAGWGVAARLVLPEAAVVEVLPQFAGGLAAPSPPRVTAGPPRVRARRTGGQRREVAAHWTDISQSVRACAVRSR